MDANHSDMGEAMDQSPKEGMEEVSRNRRDDPMVEAGMLPCGAAATFRGGCLRGGDGGGGLQEQRSGPNSRRRGAAASIWLLPVALLCFGAGMLPGGSALGPPPHLRACPGPLDGGDGAICAIKGNTSMAEATAQGLISQGRAILKVFRLGGFGGQASIEYELVNGTARGGIDFVASGGVVTWEAGQAQPRSIAIPLINTGRYTAGVGRCVSTLTAVLKSSPDYLTITGFSRTEVSIINTNANRGVMQLPAALDVSEIQVPAP